MKTTSLKRNLSIRFFVSNRKKCKKKTQYEIVS
ncbi:hypothetical protein BB65665_00895 [Bacillus sp. 916]|nr:hypothetical protein BB65665_00895 [Bacillus sp. 916]